jgi:hypothetical protein
VATLLAEATGIPPIVIEQPKLVVAEGVLRLAPAPDVPVSPGPAAGTAAAPVSGAGSPYDPVPGPDVPVSGAAGPVMTVVSPASPAAPASGAGGLGSHLGDQRSGGPGHRRPRGGLR